MVRRTRSSLTAVLVLPALLLGTWCLSSTFTAPAEITAAKKQAQLLSWAADKLVSEGSPGAAAMQAKAAAATATYEALKKGEAAPAAPPPVPVAAAPVAAPAAAPAVTMSAPAAGASSASKAEIAAAKQKADLLSWAADKLARDGSPQTAAMQAKAAAAKAEFEALKKGGAAPAAAAPAYAAAPAAAPAYAAAPVAAAPSGSVSKADLAAAKQKFQLLSWAADKLASDGSPQAPAMQAKAAAAQAEFEALKKGGAAPAAAPTPMAAPVAAPVAAAPAPVAAAPVSIPSSVSKADLEAAKKEAQLLKWAADKVKEPQMQARADAAVAKYESMKKVLQGA